MRYNVYADKRVGWYEVMDNLTHNAVGRYPRHKLAHQVAEMLNEADDEVLDALWKIEEETRNDHHRTG